MRVTSSLLKRIGGNLFRGKYRLVKEVTPLAKNNLRHEFMIEEKNMFYLRHPYLNSEEVIGFSKALGKHEKWLQSWNVKKFENFSNKHKTIEDHLEHLKIKDDWDVIK